MKKGAIIGIVVGIVLVLIIVFFLFINTKEGGTQSEDINSNQMVDCGMMNNPACFSNRMSECLPVTGTMLATDGVTEIGLVILGVENETCHFQRKINNIIDLNCYFPKGTMNWDIIDQTFGNDKGLQSAVDEACKSVV
jgi:hypothetical protein